MDKLIFINGEDNLRPNYGQLNNSTPEHVAQKFINRINNKNTVQVEFDEEQPETFKELLNKVKEIKGIA